jgi:hypothetical protein
LGDVPLAPSSLTGITAVHPVGLSARLKSIARLYGHLMEISAEFSAHEKAKL